MAAQYSDRAEAGRRLADHLSAYAGRSDVVVLGLPRGGVPVAFEVAAELQAPLDVFLVRKLGLPGQEELAMGAVASGRVRVLNDRVIEAAQVPAAVLESVTEAEYRVLDERERIYRGDRSSVPVDGKVTVLVDDGLATGTTMRAALTAVRQQGPAAVVVAVPAAAQATCERLRAEADDVVCPFTPEPFYAVGLWYANFAQTTDDEVRALLARANPGKGRRLPGHGAG
jgi:predicted phosphoribosyltransferase